MMFRETTEWSQFYWFNTDVQGQPRILLIGDSIVTGERQCIANELKGKATVAAFSTSRIVGDPAYYRELMIAFADMPVDLICFNNGLHGFNYDDKFYEAGLRMTLDLLKINSRAKIIWRNSTPITKDGHTDTLDKKLNAVVIRRNKIAEKVMKEYGIPVIDLYTQLLGHPEYRVPDGYHYMPCGYEAHAKYICPILRKYLPKAGKTSSGKNR